MITMIFVRALIKAMIFTLIIGTVCIAIREIKAKRQRDRARKEYLDEVCPKTNK